MFINKVKNIQHKLIELFEKHVMKIVIKSINNLKSTNM